MDSGKYFFKLDKTKYLQSTMIKNEHNKIVLKESKVVLFNQVSRSIVNKR